MRCLKCGRDIADEHVFCEDCQTDMAQYPVKPGTPIQLPPRHTEPAAKKKPAKKKKVLKPEEQVLKLRHSIRLLTVALIGVVIAFLLAALLTLHLLDQRDDRRVSRETFRSITVSDVSRETSF